MKVGTITYHRAVNYGAVLQTFALQKVLDKLKIDNEVIDYRASYIEWIYKPFCMRNVKNEGDFIRVLKGALIKYRKRKCFFDFLEKHVKVSAKKYYKSDMPEANSEYDLFFTGSDQVFNLDCSNYDTTYFLDFANDNNKKNSYAASFGFEKTPVNDVEQYKKLLSTFNNISVREKRGVEIVNNLVNKTAVETLDPTLLLSADEWKTIIDTPKINDEGYILVYAMAPSITLINFADKLSKMTKKKILFIKDSLTKEGVNVLSGDIKYLKNVSPSEFIELFSKAEYVITNSFHGTAFSINFNKKFFTELLDPKWNVNSRLENILDMFDLRSRQIVNLDVKLDVIDYKKVNEIIENRRKESLEFLMKSVEKSNILN